MERFGAIEKGVLLLDFYNEKSKLLVHSFRSAGFQGLVLVLQEDGFLPPDILGIYRYFYKTMKEDEGIPRFFNQVDKPDYWVLSGNMKEGEIRDQVYLRGRIHYTQEVDNSERIVSRVDWFNRKSVRRSTDHYDRYGRLYARTVYDREGKAVTITYFDEENREVLVENLRTNAIILNQDGKVRIFPNKTKFVLYFLELWQEKTGQTMGKIYYNSLSTPLFVTLELPREGRSDVLFWQEPKRSDIPGNMQLILDEKTSTKDIYVQQKDSYRKFRALGIEDPMMKTIGFVYPFYRERTNGNEVLICTNSDEIQGLAYLVERCKEMHFHIVAVTEMSTKLLDFGKYENVNVYPTVRMETVDKLYAKCNYYLDINRGGEILDAVKRGFLSNQLILALESTIHNRSYISKDHVFQEVEALGDLLCELAYDRDAIDIHLDTQRAYAMSERVEAYQQLIDT